MQLPPPGSLSPALEDLQHSLARRPRLPRIFALRCKLAAELLEFLARGVALRRGGGLELLELPASGVEVRAVRARGVDVARPALGLARGVDTFETANILKR